MSLPGLNGEPGKGDTGSIRALATQSTTRATLMTARAASCRSAVSALTVVTADFADALSVRIAALAARFDDGAQGATDLAAIMNDYADSLDVIKADAAAAQAQAQSDYDFISVRREQALNEASEFFVGWAVAWDQTLPAWMYLDKPEYLTRWQNAIDAYFVSAAVFNAVTTRREELDARIAGRLRGISLFTVITDSGGVPANGRITAINAWAGELDGMTAEQLAELGDPEVIRRVWDALDETQRNKMIEESPMTIGNLDGIPIGDRTRANAINLENEATKAENDAAALRAKLNNPATFDGMHERVAAQERKRLMDEIDDADALAEKYRGFLEQEITWVDEHGVFHSEKGARVVVFDPSQEAIATYHGPIDPVTRDIPQWIQNVAIHVPGTTTNIGSWGGPDGFGRNVYNATSNTAVFVWAGGPLPQTIPDATDASYSQDLSTKLVAFREGLVMPSGADVIVMGYSYGGAVVGLAEEAGLRADRVLYIAGAGMGDGVSSVADFPNTGDKPHYSMLSRSDIVVGLIQDLPMHGQSPVRDGSGVVRLETGFTDADDFDSPDIESTGPIQSHSSLMQPGSTSFENIIGVVEGTQVELFSESIIESYGYGVIVTDGIDDPGYQPIKVEVE
ncbi:MAG: hypothetical protein KDB08_03295 [Microthrixaceae bacterium]|nr:hypothetical protein [Microthrixaceae bacterium]